MIKGNMDCNREETRQQSATNKKNFSFFSSLRGHIRYIMPLAACQIIYRVEAVIPRRNNTIPQEGNNFTLPIPPLHIRVNRDSIMNELFVG